MTCLAAVQGLVADGHEVTFACLPEYEVLLDAAGLADRVRFVSVAYAERRPRDTRPDPRRWPYLRKVGEVEKYIDLWCPAYQAEKVAVRKGELPPSRVRSFCDAANVTPRAPTLFARPTWRAFAEGWLASKSHYWRGHLVCVQPFATTWRRSWPAQRWRELIRQLKDSGAVVVAVHSCYGPRENKLEPRLSDLGAHCFVAQDWRHVIGLLSLSELIVTVDSASLHIGAALRKRTVCLFGPTSGIATCELYSTVSVVENADACDACYLLADRFINGCWKTQEPCRRLPSVEQVLRCGGP